MRIPDRRPLLLLALLALLAAPLAGAALLAELTVVAYGAQRFDLATGFTELVDGGEVTDQASGVRLSAPWLRYAEGDLLEARDAEVDLPLGRLSAPWVEIDLQDARLVASGGVTLTETTGQVITATTVTFDAREGWATARGDVTGSDPVFTAAALHVDVDSGRLVLEGPYRYEDGLMSLRSEDPLARLQLTPLLDGDDALEGYDVGTRLDDDLVARLETVLQ
jgi:hypothetical protein